MAAAWNQETAAAEEGEATPARAVRWRPHPPGRILNTERGDPKRKAAHQVRTNFGVLLALEDGKTTQCAIRGRGTAFITSQISSTRTDFVTDLRKSLEIGHISLANCPSRLFCLQFDKKKKMSLDRRKWTEEGHFHLKTLGM